jgi:hypothetical protein
MSRFLPCLQSQCLLTRYSYSHGASPMAHMERPNAHQQEDVHPCALWNGIRLHIVRRCTSRSGGYQCGQARSRWSDTRSYVARYLGYGRMFNRYVEHRRTYVTDADLLLAVIIGCCPAFAILVNAFRLKTLYDSRGYRKQTDSNADKKRGVEWNCGPSEVEDEDGELV